MKTELTFTQKLTTDQKLQELKDRFAKRAMHYEEHQQFPQENFDDLHRMGFMGAAIDSKYGGLGFGPHLKKSKALWDITFQLAQADMGMARCWEGHANAQVMLELAANEEQKEEWFRGILAGKLWACWSGEPLTSVPHESSKIGTIVKETDEGYILNGSKVFCSGASGADWAILFVNTAGRGGARHHGNAHTVLMLACNMADDSIAIDNRWWNPMGMTNSGSYKVSFQNTFIPKENLIGYEGQFMMEELAAYLMPQYAANLLGGMTTAYEETLTYVQHIQKQENPYVQQHVGKMNLHVNTGLLWFNHVAQLWDQGQKEQAKLAGTSFRCLVEKLGQENFRHAIDVCGARSLMKPSKIEKAYRDFSLYSKHDNYDQLIAQVGKQTLGMQSDLIFGK